MTEHYYHSISSAAKLILQPLPKNETDLSDLLDTQIDEVRFVFSFNIQFVNGSLIFVRFVPSVNTLEFIFV